MNQYHVMMERKKEMQDGEETITRKMFFGNTYKEALQQLIDDPQTDPESVTLHRTGYKSND